ncbi:pitrilysin family protein [Hymenobacter sp. BT770]|uniref:M16 family metallopeptidase n=1 Tax=Hymenobacter sp. BT770 TaxID=2886942 RepID=UPI001D12BC26|nr:pitrilysin family protein [Hymenobacter sp. BT770]MCC3151604.1 insulinase family protein [Hymenobacter sp. BT770]MDO3413818.1 pitrilysin family protein [Hymenobacter sp. BT770]
MKYSTLPLLCAAWLAAAPAIAQQKPAPKPTAKPAAVSGKALTATPGGTKLVEKVTKQPGQLVIPYEKYVLPNGLTLIVSEDHSDPLVHVDVTYHVGSAREQIGKSGFAHFFEHMMFEGSDHAPKGTFDRMTIGSGGQNNGSTNTDRTNYYETLPNNQLERALWLEADRMGFLLDAVTQERFEVQRATVKNERGQNYDNRPYGLAGEYVSKTLYPYGHPYSWMTIGYLEDLDRSNVEDLKKFFLRWYGPNNATITIGGDVQPAQVVKLVEKYFGSIKRGPAVAKAKVATPVLTADRYVSYQDNIRFPMLQMTYPTVPAGHPDDLALSALSEILGGGKTSLLYKNLVKSQKAVQANASQRGSELAGQFSFVARAFPGKGLDSLETIVRSTMAEFEKRGVTDDDLRRFKAQTEAQMVNGLASVSGKVSQLAANQTFFNNPNYITVETKELKALSKADVQRVYDKYLKGKHAVILSVVPKTGGVAPAKPDNFTIDKSAYKAPKDEYAGLKYVKATDNFDRSKTPAAGANPVVKVPALYREEFANGLKVIGTRNTEIPAVTMLLTILGGHRLEQANPAKAGLASLTAAMLNEGTEKYTAEEFTAALDKLGSSVQVSAGDDRTLVSVRSLTKHLPATLALVEERLMHPRFDPADFGRVKKQTLEGIANQNTLPVVIADKTYSRLLYGPNDVMSIPASGNAATVGSLTLDDVKQFYQQNYAPNVSFLTIVGDVDQKEIAPKLAFLKAWPKKDVTLYVALSATQPDKTTVYFVNKDGAAQSEIRIGYLALPYDATGEFYRAYLANYLLGDGFTSRINMNLRESKGYTYGARSGFAGTSYAGPFTAQAGVRADATAPSVKEFMSEITNFPNGISDEELSLMQTSIGQSDALRYETGPQKALFLSRIVEYNLPTSFVDERSQILKKLTKEDVQASAKKYLPADKMYIVVVGDRKQLPALQALGYPVVELDLDGKPVVAAAPAATQAPAAAAPAAAAPAAAAPADEKTKTKDGNGKMKTKTKKG